MGISVLIVGLGNIGVGYDLNYTGDSAMTHLGACLKHPDVSSIYGIDPNDASRRIFMEAGGSEAFANFADLNKHGISADLCIISTPPGIRFEIVRQCAEFSPQIILLEKPIAETSGEARRIQSFCAEKKILLFINYIRLFEPALRSIKGKIRNGEHGKTVCGTCVFSGSVLNSASHYISLTLDWFGEPEEVQSICRIPGREHFILNYREFDFSFQAVQSDYAVGEMDIYFQKRKIEMNTNCFRVLEAGMEKSRIFPNCTMLEEARLIEPRPDILNYQYKVLDMVLTSRADASSENVENAVKTLEICAKVT